MPTEYATPDTVDPYDDFWMRWPHPDESHGVETCPECGGDVMGCHRCEAFAGRLVDGDWD